MIDIESRDRGCPTSFSISNLYLESASHISILCRCPGSEKANSTMVIVINTIALSAKDQCTPIKPPTTPTVKPLNALNPMLAIEYKPITRPRNCAGDRS